MLERLVSTPSVSSPDARFDQSNRGVVDLLAEWAEELGFDVRIELLPGAEGTRGKANLVATRGKGTGGLVLSGHTDTVPFNAERWNDDPFELTERGGRLYGLGTADMKGFFAAALHAVARVDPAELTRPITLLGTADEESGMAGARALATAGEELGRYAIIGEPTSLAPIRKHKGVLHVTVVVGGKAGHASNPALGVNAIEGMQRVIAALQAWRAELVRRGSDDEFEIAAPTLSLGRIVGGDSPNRIPDECVLDLDIRPLPGMRAEDLVRDLAAEVATALGSGPWKHDLRTQVDCPPFAGPTDRGFERAVETMCGCSAHTALFGTEAPYLTQIGLQTLVLGPGDIAVAHQPDEYVTMGDIERATELYTRLVRRFCTDAS